MDSKTIGAAEEAVRRFVRCSAELKNAAEIYESPSLPPCKTEQNRVDRYLITRSKESGALRRASMDLTRALAELRKSH